MEIKINKQQAIDIIAGRQTFLTTWLKFYKAVQHNQKIKLIIHNNLNPTGGYINCKVSFIPQQQLPSTFTDNFQSFGIKVIDFRAVHPNNNIYFNE